MENAAQKPVAKVTGEDGNVFNTLGICAKVLRRAGMGVNAEELTERVFASDSYEEALVIMGEYCELR